MTLEMMYRHVCDGCGDVSGTFPADTGILRHRGWTKVQGKDYCEKCSRNGEVMRQAINEYGEGVHDAQPE